jgi:hypothetical protein
MRKQLLATTLLLIITATTSCRSPARTEPTTVTVTVRGVFNPPVHVKFGVFERAMLSTLLRKLQPLPARAGLWGITIQRTTPSGIIEEYPADGLSILKAPEFGNDVFLENGDVIVIPKLLTM